MTATLTTVIVLVVGFFLVLLPLKLAAAAVSAKRTGFGWCFLALLLATFMHSLGLSLPVFGSIAAFIFSAMSFSLILGTGFLGGIGIAILHLVFSALLLFVASLFGIGAMAALTMPEFIHQLQLFFQ